MVKSQKKANQQSTSKAVKQSPPKLTAPTEQNKPKTDKCPLTQLFKTKNVKTYNYELPICKETVKKQTVNLRQHLLKSVPKFQLMSINKKTFIKLHELYFKVVLTEKGRKHIYIKDKKNYPGTTAYHLIQHVLEKTNKAEIKREKKLDAIQTIINKLAKHFYNLNKFVHSNDRKGFEEALKKMFKCSHGHRWDDEKKGRDFKHAFLQFFNYTRLQHYQTFRGFFYDNFKESFESIDKNLVVATLKDAYGINFV